MSADKEKTIIGYLRNELCDIERKQLEDWMSEDPKHEREIQLLSKVWNTPMSYPELVNMEDEQKKLWNRLQRENKYSINHRKDYLPTIGNVFRYAAAIILLLGLGYIFWDNIQFNTHETPFLTETIERVNPPGQKSQIQLPDGSKVVLNADSKLSYTTDFGGSTRKIQLKGEAYFEVVENPFIPFEVYTDHLVITALGTSFNICAFDGQQIEKIALNTGKVKIQHLTKPGSSIASSYLEPGELASFNIISNKIDISKYGNIDPYGWKEGRIVFHEATFHEVIEVLSRWYNVEFEVTGSLNREWSYGSTFTDENLKNVLENLKFSEKIEYELNGSVVNLKL